MSQKNGAEDKYNEMIGIVDRILNLSTGITRDQFKDLHQSSSVSGEVRIWIALLDLSLKDLDFADSIDPAKKKIAREAMQWLENDQFTMELVSVALDRICQMSVPTEMIRKRLVIKAKQILEKRFFIT